MLNSVRCSVQSSIQCAVPKSVLCAVPKSVQCAVPKSVQCTAPNSVQCSLWVCPITWATPLALPPKFSGYTVVLSLKGILNSVCFTQYNVVLSLHGLMHSCFTQCTVTTIKCTVLLKYLLQRRLVPCSLWLWSHPISCPCKVPTCWL